MVWRATTAGLFFCRNVAREFASVGLGPLRRVHAEATFAGRCVSRRARRLNLCRSDAFTAGSFDAVPAEATVRRLWRTWAACTRC